MLTKPKRLGIVIVRWKFGFFVLTEDYEAVTPVQAKI
jgi:hypothetical protein